MKTYNMIRANQSTAIVELSFWDMIRLLFGREIMIVEKNERIVLRHYHAYVLLNTKASTGD
jgi:hypothetical protein